MTPLLIALNRFGLGHRAGDSYPRDPKAWLKGQIAAYRPYDGELTAANYNAAAVVARIEASEDLVSKRRALSKSGGDAAAKQITALTATAGRAAVDQLRADAGTRLRSAIATPTPFPERMVHFWANHFAVSAAKPRLPNLVGIHEFAAIRPFVTGTFAQLLRAAVLHPAMLYYLDQTRSTGPNSAELSGRPKARRGLNENLGREILELHTLGVDGGYTQKDVLALSLALTGWVAQGGAEAVQARPFAGGSAFDPAMHEPGAKTLLGKTYPQDGADQALAMLDDLAVHPSTARHVATKLARHFGGDVPPPAMVRRIEDRFLASRGDLAEVYRAIVDSPEAWSEKPLKMRQPWEWLVALMRSVAHTALPDGLVFATLNELAQPIWRPTSPAGWEDAQAAWLGPDALLRRVRASETLARRIPPADIRKVAQDAFPDALSAVTEAYLRGAESNQMAFVLLAVSPDMMRR